MRDAEAAKWSDIVHAVRTAIAADYVDRLELLTTRGSRAGLTRAQVDDSIRDHAVDRAEENRFAALIAATLGDRAYGAGDWTAARRFYADALRHDGRQPGVRVKHSLMALGPVGAGARRTAARLRTAFAPSRA